MNGGRLLSKMGSSEAVAAASRQRQAAGAADAHLKKRASLMPIWYSCVSSAKPCRRGSHSGGRAWRQGADGLSRQAVAAARQRRRQAWLCKAWRAGIGGFSGRPGGCCRTRRTPACPRAAAGPPPNTDRMFHPLTPYWRAQRDSEHCQELWRRLRWCLVRQGAPSTEKKPS
jgi:hypothetical protein